MTAKAVIGAALIALMPQVSGATSIAIPVDCSDGMTDYSFTEALPGGLIYSSYYGAKGEDMEILVSCSAGQAVIAKAPMQRDEVYFTELTRRLAESGETYTFNDIAKLAREGGYEAKVESFAKDSCLCRGNW